MFSKLKKMFAQGDAASPDPSLADARHLAMVSELGEPDHIDRDGDTAHRVDVYAFGRNFVEECDDEADDDDGYVLVTSGMSDRLMAVPAADEDGEGGGDGDGGESAAAELVWYVRDLNPEYFANLRWLAKLPFIDRTWFGLGHTVPMPAPPLSFCDFSTFLLLPPLVSTDRHLLSALDHDGHPIATLCVHLLSPAEYALVKGGGEGLDAFLDLLDERGYPLVFDPQRESYVD